MGHGIVYAVVVSFVKKKKKKKDHEGIERKYNDQTILKTVHSPVFSQPIGFSRLKSTLLDNRRSLWEVYSLVTVSVSL